MGKYLKNLIYCAAYQKSLPVSAKDGGIIHHNTFKGGK